MFYRLVGGPLEVRSRGPATSCLAESTSSEMDIAEMSFR
jgi:hypothetical protein